MALALTIAGTDRTKLITMGSLRISNVLSSQADTASFRVNKFGTRTLSPTVGQEVIVTKDGTRLFAGRITEVQEEYDKLDFVGYAVQCTDYTRDLDQRLVVDAFTDRTVAQIIAAIAADYLDERFSTAGVDCDTVIRYIAFNYEYPSACLRQLAELVGFDWYVDPNRVIYFISKTTNTAPFDLDDTSGNYLYETLQIRKDISPVRNTVFVRGGEYLGNTITAAYVTETNQKHFNLPYRFSDIKVMVTGQEKSVGIDNIDPETSYDALYNFAEKVVKLRSDKVSDTSVVRISGRPYLPVLVKLRDPASIAQFSADEGNSGVYEYKIVDKSIKSKEGARQRANAELLAYAQTMTQGSFSTLTDGLRAGQRIRVQSTLRGLDAYYVINRVEATPAGDGATFEYRVSLVTTKTFDYVQFLQALLQSKDKEIVIANNEVLDEIESVTEEVTFSEVFTVQPLDYPVQFVLGPWTPSGYKRQFVLNGSVLS